MKPPLPSPSARDCPKCGAQLDIVRLQFCPQCGAALEDRAQLPIFTIIGATVLGIVCLPIGACSIFVMVIPGGSYEIPDSFIRSVALVPLLLAALGIYGMMKLLRKK